MRPILALFTSVLFSMVCAAQSSAPSPGSPQQSGAAQSGSQPADPNQNPVSPLQEPPKPTDAQLNKPKASTFELGNTNSGQDQQLGEVRLMDRYTEVNGDQSRSFRIPGSNNLAEFNYFRDQRFLTNHRVQALSMYRGTDDNSIDPEHNSLQKAYVRIFGQRDEFIAGDALVNYSRLTFNQNIKGLSATSMIGDNWRLSGVGGIFIDRWGSLYKELIGRPFIAVVTGARLERTIFNPDSRFGFNFSSSRDQTSSLPPDLVGISPLPASNQVGSIDQKFQSKNGLRFESEYAYSFTDFDTRFSPGGCVAPCDTRIPQPTLNGRQSDWGLRAESSWRYHKLSLRGSYVRYQPNFASINARQISDLQDFVARTSYDIATWLTLDGTLRRSNNDLKKQLPFETSLWGPEMHFIFHDLPFYRRGVFDVGYRHRIVNASDGSVNRFVRIPYAEFTLPAKQTFITIGYERRQAQDQIDPSQTSNTDRVYAGLRGVYDIARWHFNPGLRYELERLSQRPRLIATPIDFTLDRDSNRLSSATLFVEAPRYFVMEGAFRLSSATIFGPNGFYRPSYRGSVTYKIRNDENMLFTFGFERNSNNYFTSPNYDERIWSGTLVYRFGRKGL